MQLIHAIDQLDEACRPGVSLSIGMFDGVHRGHQMLIGRVLEQAEQLGTRSMTLTFCNHPLSVLAPPFAPSLLSSPEEKSALLAGLGLNLCLLLEFTPEFAAIEAEAFIEEILIRRCRVRFLSCGEDFRFGARGKGDIGMLARYAAREAFALEVHGSLLEDGSPIRSTRIRQFLMDGKLEAANKMLGHPYQLSGVVAQGDRRGRTIGFPTANLVPPGERLVPGDGVYAAHAEIDDRHYGAMVNIGVRPTFAGDRRTIEAHLFDFDGDLYGVQLRLAFVNKVREEQRFDSVEALVKQLRSDEKLCRALLDIG